MKRSILYIAVLFLLATMLLISCGETTPPIVNQPPVVTEDGPTKDILPDLASYKLVYPEGDSDAQSAAKYLSGKFANEANANVAVISDAEYTEADTHIITVGAVKIEADEGKKIQRTIARESNALYGAFCASFEGTHIYLLADESKTLKAAAEYFNGTYIKSTDITVPGPDSAEIVYFSKAKYEKLSIDDSVITREDLMSMTTISDVAPKSGEVVRIENNTREGFTVVIEKGNATPTLLCETASPFAEYKLGLYNPTTQKQTVTVTAGDKKTKQEYTISFKIINPKYLYNISDDGLRMAMEIAPTEFLSNKGNWNNELDGANALLMLVLQENAHPGSTVDNKPIAPRIVQHLRSVCVTGQEPQMHVGPWWANPNFSCAVAVAKQTPTVWNQLTDGEVERYDWIMRSYAIITNYASNSQNNFLTGPEMKGNFNKGWNPNFQSSNLIPILACVSYFGSADAVNEILTSFSYDAYMAKFKELGFTNIIQTWSVGDTTNGQTGFVKTLMEKGMGTASAPFTYKNASGASNSGGYGVGVKVEFTYGSEKIPLKEVAKIFNKQIDVLYRDRVTSKIGQAYIVGDLTSPFQGQTGMMAEYNTSDASGIRSDASYCTHNFGMMVPSMAALIALDLWDPDDADNKAKFSQVYVGNEDHIFKLVNGYRSFSHGKYVNSGGHNEQNIGEVYHMAKYVWRDYLVNFIKP